MHRHLTIVCALSILLLGILTLTFSTHAKRSFQPMQSPAPVNVALATNGAVASASSAYVNGNFPVAAVNNGDRKGTNWGSGGGWNDNSPGDYSSDIVQINLPSFNFVSQINVFTLRDNFQDNQTPPTLSETFNTCENGGYGITEFEVQYWNGSMWVTVPGGLVRDNNKIWRQLNFPEVWTSAVRVQVHGAVQFTTAAINYSRIIELEAYGRTAGFNLAAAANGALAVASSQINAAYPVTAVNDGDRTGFNWNRGGFGSGWNDATENEYIQLTGCGLISRVDKHDASTRSTCIRCAMDSAPRPTTQRSSKLSRRVMTVVATESQITTYSIYQAAYGATCLVAR